jgi:hypothetical protein
MSDRFSDACMAAVSDPDLNALPPIGSIDQVADSTDLLAYPDRYLATRALFKAPSAP